MAMSIRELHMQSASLLWTLHSMVMLRSIAEVLTAPDSPGRAAQTAVRRPTYILPAFSSPQGRSMLPQRCEGGCKSL